MSDSPAEDEHQANDSPAPSSEVPASSQQHDTLVQLCSKCGHRNRPGTAICDNCGASLIGEPTGIATKEFNQGEKSQASMTDTSEIMRVMVTSAGTDVFTEDMVLRLEIEGATTPILLFPKKETVIGRRDPASGTMPDVDLTSYAGYRMGVSRRHAVIRLRNNSVEIFDLGSSNGTTVNGTKLEPHQPQSLRDGDEINLGKMNLRVLFQVRSRRRRSS